jgi:hypothetical protein
MGVERFPEISMKQITDRMAEAATRAILYTNEFKQTK